MSGWQPGQATGLAFPPLQSTVEVSVDSYNVLGRDNARGTILGGLLSPLMVLLP